MFELTTEILFVIFENILLKITFTPKLSSFLEINIYIVSIRVRLRLCYYLRLAKGIDLLFQDFKVQLVALLNPLED